MPAIPASNGTRHAGSGCGCGRHGGGQHGPREAGELASRTGLVVVAGRALPWLPERCLRSQDGGALSDEVGGWRHAPQGRMAYQRRTRGEPWLQIARRLGYASDRVARGMARRFAQRAGLPWPVPTSTSGPPTGPSRTERAATADRRRCSGPTGSDLGRPTYSRKRHRYGIRLAFGRKASRRAARALPQVTETDCLEWNTRIQIVSAPATWGRSLSVQVVEGRTGSESGRDFQDNLPHPAAESRSAPDFCKRLLNI